MIVIDGIPQGSKEWLKLRLGVVTGSGVSKVFNFGQSKGWRHHGCTTWHSTEEIADRCKKGSGAPQYAEEMTAGLSSQRFAYRNQLLAEWATGEPVDEWRGNDWTDRGLEFEGHACDFFRFETGLDVKACAFVFRDESRTCGASPDALVLDDAGEIIGGLEIKCPLSSTHVGYLLDGRRQYEEQLQMGLYASGLPCWWFLSYFPGMPPYLSTVLPVQEYQQAFGEHIPRFLDELRRGRDRLEELGIRGQSDTMQHIQTEDRK